MKMYENTRFWVENSENTLPDAKRFLPILSGDPWGKGKCFVKYLHASEGEGGNLQLIIGRKAWAKGELALEIIQVAATLKGECSSSCVLVFQRFGAFGAELLTVFSTSPRLRRQTSNYFSAFRRLRRRTSDCFQRFGTFSAELLIVFQRFGALGAGLLIVFQRFGTFGAELLIVVHRFGAFGAKLVAAKQGEGQRGEMF